MSRPTRPTGRWSARRMVSVVLKLLRGVDLETLSRRHGVTAAKISEWRDAFLASVDTQTRPLMDT
jgi:transposase